MNNFNYQYSVRQHFGKGCAEGASEEEMKHVGKRVLLAVGHNLPKEFVPMGAVVTVSGTGAEQNNGAVITNEEKKLKQPLFGAENEGGRLTY